MKLTNSIAGVMALALAWQAPAAAQACAALKTPAAGSWAEYQTENGNMRLALLGSEARAGKTFLRMEMSMTTKDGPAILQMLVPGYPYEMSAIEDLVMKAGNQPAMRMSAQMIGMMRSRMPKDAIAEACRSTRMTRVGEESVTVPAGTFPAVHYHDPESKNDVWVSESVPFGLIKVHPAGGADIVLTGKGTDAKSRITETPMEMPGM